MAASSGTSAAAAPRIDGDSLPVAALVVHGDGTVQSANPLACGLFGLSAGQLAGLSIDRLLSPVSRMALHTHVLPRLSEGGLVQGSILSVVNTSGAEVDVVVNASVIAPGDPPAIAMLLLPTPGDRQREERFLRMQRAADAAPAMLFEWVVDAQGRGRLPYASAGLLTLFGLTAESVREDDGPLIARLHPDDGVRVRDELRLAAEASRPAFGRYRARLDAGDDWSWYGLRATSRRAPGGETVWHGTWADVTEQRRAEEAERAFGRGFAGGAADSGDAGHPREPQSDLRRRHFDLYDLGFCRRLSLGRAEWLQQHLAFPGGVVSGDDGHGGRVQPFCHGKWLLFCTCNRYHRRQQPARRADHRRARHDLRERHATPEHRLQLRPIRMDRPPRLRAGDFDQSLPQHDH